MWALHWIVTWNWDLGGDVLAQHLDVVLELGRDGNDGGGLCDGPVDKRLDLSELFLGLSLCRQVDLVLEDQDVLQLHNLDGGQMLGSLWLGAGLVGSWKRKR